MAQGSKKRTTGKSNSGAGRTKRTQEVQEIPEFLRGEVLIIVSLAAAVLLFLSNFHLCGVVGDFLRGVQLGLFGAVGYVFPVLLFTGISFYVSNAGSLKAVIKLSGVTGVVITVCGLAQMIFGFWPAEGDGMLAFYRESSLSGGGGGLIGGLLSSMLRAVVGNIGTYLLLIALLVICCVIVTEKSVVNAVKRGSGRAYQHAKEDVARRKEEWQEIQEERRRSREDKVVRGVDFGSITIHEGMGGVSPAAYPLGAQEGPKMADAGNGGYQVQAGMDAVPDNPEANKKGPGTRRKAGTNAAEDGRTAGYGQSVNDVPGANVPDAEAGRYGQGPLIMGNYGAEPAGMGNRNPEPAGMGNYGTGASMAGSAGAEKDSGTGLSSADVFSGRIEVPPEFVEPAPFDEDGEEEKEKPEDRMVSFVGRANREGLQEKAASVVKKNEPLYARRELKTLEELDMTISDLEDALGGSDWMDEQGEDVLGGFLDEPAEEDFLDSDYQDDETFMEDDGFAEDARYLREQKAEAEEVPYAGHRDALHGDGLRDDDLHGEALAAMDRREGRERGSSYPNTQVVEEGAGEDLADEYLDSGDDPDFDDDEAYFSADKNSIFMSEGEKRVVTASGKVIETETEMLHKKIEQHREEAAKEDPGAAARAQMKQPQPVVKKPYVFPPTSLLQKGSHGQNGFSDQEYKETAIKLQQTLKNFGVGVTVTNISCGPSVTRYELHPEQGVKVSKIVSLTDDIKLNLAAAEIRIEAPIPGKSAVGIEVPNKETAMVYLRDLLESDGFLSSKSRLAFAVGKDIAGQPVITDIGKMPHLLIAGATGSGKSVCINTLIMSIIFKADPEDVKLIMVDPKVVELSVYNGIPHLLIPVVTDPKKASGALNWAVAEMDDRYRKFAQFNVRNLQGYNEKIKTMSGLPEEERPQKMPQIVIIIDELADLMMVVPGEVEDAICRLAQLARAAGIHLVIATQRPSVNVITGSIKANVPSRIAFAVSSGVDSRTIIDMNGAEKLLGKGDMLFFPSGIPKPQRVQGAFVSDQEVSNVVEFLTEQGLTVDYNPEMENKVVSGNGMSAAAADSSRDEYFAQAGKFIIEKEKASIGMLQRVFKIGFNRAARIMDQLADAGVVGEEEGTKPRKVLMTMEEFEQMMQ